MDKKSTCYQMFSKAKSSTKNTIHCKIGFRSNSLLFVGFLNVSVLKDMGGCGGGQGLAHALAMSNRHHDPIPSTSATSRLEHVLASFDDNRRIVSTSPVGSYQPRVIRSSLPVTSSHRRPAQSVLKHANTATTPAYLTIALLANVFRPGAQPVQQASNSSDSEDELTPITWPKSLHIPTQWNEDDKSNHLIISSNGRDISFDSHTNAMDGRDAAAVRAECPIPAACGIYYYEVRILDRGVKGWVFATSLVLATHSFTDRFRLGTQLP